MSSSAREEELNTREDALDEREKALDDREAKADSQPDAPAPAPPPPAEDSGSDLTAGQENAISSAVSYLEMSGFSRSGLIDQLKFEGYTQEQAEYGVTKAGL